MNEIYVTYFIYNLWLNIIHMVSLWVIIKRQNWQEHSKTNHPLFCGSQMMSCKSVMSWCSDTTQIYWESNDLWWKCWWQDIKDKFVTLQGKKANCSVLFWLQHCTVSSASGNKYKCLATAPLFLCLVAIFFFWLSRVLAKSFLVIL